VKRLSEFRGNRHNDDETLLVLQRESRICSYFGMGQGGESQHLQPSS
jgi:hypothetical protein